MIESGETFYKITANRLAKRILCTFLGDSLLNPVFGDLFVETNSGPEDSISYV